MEKKSAEKSAKVFVGNLPLSMNWPEVKSIFSGIGAVQYVQIYRSKTGESKGCGVVEFISATEANVAVEKVDGKDINGQEIKVRLDENCVNDGKDDLREFEKVPLGPNSVNG